MKRKELLEIMRGSTYKPLSAEELVSELEIDDISSFLELLRDLEREGSIILTRRQKYGLPERMGLITGRLQGHMKGFAFLIPTDIGRQDIYIGPEHLNGALHNDRVVVRMLPRKSRAAKPEGEVIRILQRANKTVVGTFDKYRKYGFVIPDDKRLGVDVFIPAEDIGYAEHQDKVVVEITKWSEGRRSPEGRVLQVLGKGGTPGVDILSIVHKFGLPETFPAKVLEEVREIPLKVQPKDWKGRRDLTKVKAVTIDGADAKDLDDAISIEALEDGYRLMVHIADVGYYVKEGSLLDQEALARGTSVYLVDRVIPMLPPELSNGICSLNAGEDRLAMTVSMDLDKNGRLLSHEFFPSVVNITLRMTYDDVRSILIDEDPDLLEKYKDFVAEFKLMAQLAETLFEKRVKRGAIDFNFPEYKVILDENGKPMEIQKRYRSIAESIIEEFMILTNETIAEHMYWLEAPFIYRVHEEPTFESVEELNDFLHNLGHHIKITDREILPRNFQEVINQVSGKPEERIVNTVVLRSMKHARYSHEPLGHFGLASEYYCHFTAPIRRYPDLAIHRIMREYLLGKPAEKRILALEEEVGSWAEHASIREKAAEEAERESVELKMVEYMERHLGDILPGIISGVTNFGLFVELENGVEGLVHVSTMTDDYYIFQEKRLTLLGEHTKKSYRLGDQVNVLVAKVNTEERQIDFELREEEARN